MAASPTRSSASLAAGIERNGLATLSAQLASFRVRPVHACPGPGVGCRDRRPRHRARRRRRLFHPGGDGLLPEPSGNFGQAPAAIFTAIGLSFLLAGLIYFPRCGRHDRAAGRYAGLRAELAEGKLSRTWHRRRRLAFPGRHLSRDRLWPARVHDRRVCRRDADHGRTDRPRRVRPRHRHRVDLRHRAHSANRAPPPQALSVTRPGSRSCRSARLRPCDCRRPSPRRSRTPCRSPA
jgi:hypothetical protein